MTSPPTLAQRAARHLSRLLVAAALAVVAAGCAASGALHAGPASQGASCSTEGVEAVDRAASTLDLPDGVELEQHVTYPRLPCGWVRTRHGMAVRGASDGFSPNINVLHRRLLADQPVVDFARSSRAQFDGLRRQPGSAFRQLRFGPAPVFGGQPGYEFAFTRISEGRQLVQVQDYLVHGRDAWSATLTATQDQYGASEREMLRVLHAATIGA